MIKVIDLKEEKQLDKKTEILNYLDSIDGKPLTRYLKDNLLNKRQEFLDWLKEEDLYYLLTDTTRQKTFFEWQCFTEIVDLLFHFDTIIEQADRGFGEPIDSMNERLRRKMVYFSDEYKDKSIINKLYKGV